MRRKQSSISKSLGILRIPNLNLLLNRGYLVSGEDLPDEIKRKSKVVYVGTGLTFSSAFLGLNYLKNVLVDFKPVVTTFFENGFSDESMKALGFFQPIQMPYLYDINLGMGLLTTVPLAIIPSFMIYKKLSSKFDRLHHGQKGDNRLTTMKEIINQYFEIPDKKEPFEGIGGVQISHYKNKYYIDRDTVNTLFLGTSRSGKGEIYVIPMLDILSRAMEKCSIIANDPKGGAPRSAVKSCGCA